MKAILVIDMPERCRDCKCFVNDGNSIYCAWTKTNIKDSYEKNSDCPLRPMPDKRSEDYTSDFQALYRAEARGWNACIEELEK